MKRRKRGVSNRAFVLILTLALVLGCVIGGTVTWLTATTDPVVNTFTYGDINLTLTEEHPGPYKIVPGNTIEKDPLVSVTAGSEACWLFVKVEENDWPIIDDVRMADYEIADGWTSLAGANGVYYREVSAQDADSGIQYLVLKNNQVTVSSNLTKTQVATLKKNNNNTTLTFTAYAVQKDNISDVNTAWDQVKDL